MTDSTDLARAAPSMRVPSSQCNSLIEPDGMPPVVRIMWPAQPTVVDPRRFPEAAAAAMRLLANASTELARRKAARRR